ncbi:hypothetical protein FHS96_000719 [Sphingomonas zeicaulis]|uniref:hypothetical protein n=1 Tax=Sphingomonas zeicaulis TaxID=1632740 RepID=UPI003D1A3716
MADVAHAGVEATLERQCDQRIERLHRDHQATGDAHEQADRLPALTQEDGQRARRFGLGRGNPAKASSSIALRHGAIAKGRPASAA